MTDEEKLMTVDEVCELLHIGRITLWRHIKSERFPFYRAGRRLFFKKSEILNSIHSTNKNRDFILPEPGRTV